MRANELRNELLELIRCVVDMPVYSVHIGELEEYADYVYFGREVFKDGVFNVDIDVVSLSKDIRVNTSQLIIRELNLRGRSKLINTYENGNRNILIYDIW